MSEQQRAGIPRPPIYRITLAQIVALLLAVLLVWLVWPAYAGAMLAGGAIEITARAYFSFYAFRYMGAGQIRQVVRSFRRGELGKFMLVAVLFGGIFMLDLELAPVAVFAGYLWAWLSGTLLGMRLLR